MADDRGILASLLGLFGGARPQVPLASLPIGKMPSPDFTAPPPGLQPSQPLGMPPGMTMAQPPVLPLESIKGLAGGAVEPLGQLGRVMTGSSEHWPMDLAGAALGLAPIGPPGKGAALKAGAEAIEGAVGRGAAQGAKAVAGNTGGLSDFITAYHGSPHDFDRFDLSKIGTGEGAQAYGRGLYFAENPEVAEGYKTVLQGKNTDWNDPASVAGHFFALGGDDHKNAANLLQSFISRPKPGYDRAVLEGAQQLLQKGGDLPPPKAGKMYQVAIKADPEHFLDWDKPLSKQNPKVIGTLEKHGLTSDLDKVSPRDQSSVEHIMDYLKRGLDERAPVRSDAEVVKMLNEAGIPGIKYLDQGSRLKPFAAERIKQIDRALVESPGAGTAADDARIAKLHAERKQLASAETRNYVVFDDKLIDILKKYGIAGLAALPAMNAYHYQDKGQ